MFDQISKLAKYRLDKHAGPEAYDTENYGWFVKQLGGPLSIRDRRYLRDRRQERIQISGNVSSVCLHETYVELQLSRL